MNNSSTAAELADPTVRNVRLACYITAFVVGLLGNTLVAGIIIRKPRRSIHHMFILNLAISDLTYLAFCVPISTYELYEQIWKRDFFCRFVYPMQTLTYFTSIFTITSMAIHRCYVIVNPYKAKIKHRTAQVWIVMIWMAALVIVIPLAVVATPVGGRCNEVWPSFDHRRAYTAALFLFQFLLPLFLIALAYIWIGAYLIKNKGPQTMIGSRKAVSHQSRKRRENMQIITSLAAIVVLFTLCMLPGQVAWMIMDFGTAEQQDATTILLRLSNILDFFHACVNPIAYGLLTDAFRSDYKQVFAAFIKLVTCGQTTISPDRDLECTNNPNTPTIHVRPMSAAGEVISIYSRSSSPIRSQSVITSLQNESPHRESVSTTNETTLHVTRAYSASQNSL